MKQNPKTTVEAIQFATCVEFGISIGDLTGPRRNWIYSHPRFLAAKMIKDRTKLSFPQIGRRFGNRDHTTMLNAVNRASQLLEHDPDLRIRYQRIERETESFGAVIFTRRKNLLGHFKSRRSNLARVPE